MGKELAPDVGWQAPPTKAFLLLALGRHTCPAGTGCWKDSALWQSPDLFLLQEHRWEVTTTDM